MHMHAYNPLYNIHIHACIQHIDAYECIYYPDPIELHFA